MLFRQLVFVVLLFGFVSPLTADLHHPLCNCSGKPVAPVAITIAQKDTPSDTIPFPVKVTVSSTLSWKQATIEVKLSDELALVDGQLSWSGELKAGESVELDLQLLLTGASGEVIATCGIYSAGDTKRFRAQSHTITLPGAVAKSSNLLKAITGRAVGQNVIEVQGVER